MTTLLAPPPSITTSRTATEHHFPSHDNTPLFYRAWLPEVPPTKSILLFHRGHEHSARWQPLIDALSKHPDFADAAFFAHDARGHGQSPGERGHAPDLSWFIKDADTFAQHISREYDIPLEDTAVIAHSVGAVIAAAWIQDYAPPIRAMVLATPALAVKLYVPLALPSLRMLNKVKEKSFIKSYVKSRMLTSDPDQQRAYDNDPLISKQIATNILLDLFDTSNRLIKDAGAIDTPALLLTAGNDWVVKNRAIKKFHDRLGSTDKQFTLVQNAKHAIFHDVARDETFARTADFLARRFDRTPARTINTVYAHTRREYDRLTKPSPWYCPKALAYRTNKLFLRTAGRLSQGIRLAWRTGFDSGPSLDYVYENRSRGITPLGKLIDHFYLNTIGWRGIRQRKQNLQQLLRHVINEQLSRGRKVHITDIAGGPARYVLDVLHQLSTQDSITATIRDKNLPALEQGKALANHLNLTNVTHEPGDAFNTAELSRLNPKPTIVIVSGLYELFEDNTLIHASLKGLAAALASGDYLIYTNQPWHPQQEFIARTLPNREGQPWIMRCRTQKEIDHLVREAGFEKQETLTDKWGIFTVTLARRI